MRPILTIAFALASTAGSVAGDRTDLRCIAYGKGFVYSQGTGFCVKLGGEIEGGVIVGSVKTKSGLRNGSAFDSSVSVHLDARKETDYGPVRIYIEGKGRP